VSPAHDRMLVILPPASYGEWPGPQTREARLVSLLKPYPADEVQVAEVGPAVNSPKNDGPECLDAASGQGGPGEGHPPSRPAQLAHLPPQPLHLADQTVELRLHPAGARRFRRDEFLEPQFRQECLEPAELFPLRLQLAD